MTTLNYQTPVPPRRAISWWLAPVFVLLPTGATLLAFVFSGHTGTQHLFLALCSPALLCVLPFQNRGEALVLSLALGAVVTQFTVYFILLRTRRSRPMWCVLGFHVACCAAVWLIVSLR